MPKTSCFSWLLAKLVGFVGKEKVVVYEKACLFETGVFEIDSACK